MRKAVLLSIGILCLFMACKQTLSKVETKNIGYTIEYAKGFCVEKYEDYTLIKIPNPWDTTKIMQSYVLVDRRIKLPEKLPQGTIIRTPIQSAVAYSVVHCTSLFELGMSEVLKGVCESEYIRNESIRQKVANGDIIDIGMASSPDIEKIMMLSPEVIFTSPINGQSYGQVEKLRIPIIEVPDYTESDPLGRAEWIRFYSLFTNTEAIADSLFEITKTNYNQVKELVSDITNRPTVFTDLPYQSNWNMPGGKSYIAQMLSDAGADYIWKDSESTTFMPLSFETVLDKAGEADMWLLKYHSPEDLTLKTLKQERTSYSLFKAYKHRKVYGCNSYNKNYYEDIHTHPDYILSDFAAIFHPELFPNYEPKYYDKLKD